MSKSELISKKDYQSTNEVRWCPGCGDYAILSTVQKTLADLNMRRENTVFVSGIGCAARFPYYMNTFGLHTIHGRAPAFVTGLKLANPSLHVFLVTGDGDGLSIGGNHLIHLFRRNLDVTVLLFNNRIYGLTKGQYSPTSDLGHKAKSTPYGALENPLNPIALAMAANATFVARALDNDATGLSEVLKAAIAHPGTSFVEIYQSCVVFNDEAFASLKDKANQNKTLLRLEDNRPLLFEQGKKGLALDSATLTPYIVDLEKNPEQKDQVVLFKRDLKNGLLSHMLSKLEPPDFPVPMGIFRQVCEPTYEYKKACQDQEILNKALPSDLLNLYQSGGTWKV